MCTLFRILFMISLVSLFPGEKSKEITTNHKSVQLYYLIEKYSDMYGVPKKIAYNISYKETTYMGPLHFDYDPHRSSKTAHGPMQITISTSNMVNGDRSSKDKIKFDLDYNVKTSMKLLNILYLKYGRWDKACGAYNTGKPIINGYAKFCTTNNYKDNWIN